MKKWLKILISTVLSIILILFLSSTFYVEHQVQETCELAISKYPGNRVQALIRMAESHQECDDEKSRALWALGQLGDEEALPYLIGNYDSTEETNLCIHEAQFAIEKIRKNQFNLPAFLWRSLLEK